MHYGGGIAQYFSFQHFRTRMCECDDPAQDSGVLPQGEDVIKDPQARKEFVEQADEDGKQQKVPCQFPCLPYHFPPVHSSPRRTLYQYYNPPHRNHEPHHPLQIPFVVVLPYVLKHHAFTVSQYDLCISIGDEVLNAHEHVPSQKCDYRVQRTLRPSMLKWERREGAYYSLRVSVQSPLRQTHC